jgi:hypothetical protein
VNELGRAHATLFWAGLLVAAAAVLVDRARRDVDQARVTARIDRNARIDAEDTAERAQADLDRALERLHERMTPEERDEADAEPAGE